MLMPQYEVLSAKAFMHGLGPLIRAYVAAWVHSGARAVDGESAGSGVAANRAGARPKQAGEASATPPCMPQRRFGASKTQRNQLFDGNIREILEIARIRGGFG